jgi:hypothetical protein
VLELRQAEVGSDGFVRYCAASWVRRVGPSVPLLGATAALSCILLSCDAQPHVRPCPHYGARGIGAPCIPALPIDEAHSGIVQLYRSVQQRLRVAAVDW